MRASPRVATALFVALLLPACAGGDGPDEELAVPAATALETEPDDDPAGQPDAEPDAEPEPDTDPDPEPTGAPEPEPEPTADAQPSPEPQPAANPCDEREPQSFSTSVGDFLFEPADRSDLCVGDRITFTNAGEISHTATNRAGAFDTGTLAAGASATVTLDRTGELRYVCLFHSQMNGTLTVVG